MQPEGVLVEKTHSSLLCPKGGWTQEGGWADVLRAIDDSHTQKESAGCGGIAYNPGRVQRQEDRHEFEVNLV